MISLHILLRFEPARFRPQFENRETRAVIDEDFRFGQFRCRGGETWEIAFGEEIRRAPFASSRARASRADVAQAAGCSSPG